MKSYKFTDFQLEQFLLNELPDEMMENIRMQIHTDSELKSRVDELKNSSSDILEKYRADLMAVKIRSGLMLENEKIHASVSGTSQNNLTAKDNNSFMKIFSDYFKGRSPKLIYSISAASVSVMAAFVIFFNLPGIFTGNIPVKNDDVTRIKGMEPGISIHRKTGSSIEELKDMTKASQGDLLQIGYISTGEYKYGTILSTDGRGSVTLHFPESESGETLIKVNRKVMLKRAYELDDSPDYEKFILIISKKPIDVKSIIEKAKILAQSRESALNGQLTADGSSLEFSLTLKK